LGKSNFLNYFNNLIDYIKVSKTNKIPIQIYYDNDNYCIKDGYDPVTGLGVPDVGKMLKWLDQNTK